MFKRFILLLTFILWAQGAFAQSDAALERLKKVACDLNSVESDFVQEKKLKMFTSPLILTGKVYLKKPDLFAWHTFSPVHYSLVMNKGTARQWDEDSRQVQTMPLKNNPAFAAAITQMRKWFEGDYRSLAADYDLGVLQDNPLAVSFSAKKGFAGAQFIKEINLYFRPDMRYIARIEVIETSGDTTTITFSNTKINVPIDHAAWEVKSRV